MRNKLSFFGAMFLLLLVGRVGSIGTLGNISWLKVFSPLVIDVIIDYAAVMDKKYFIGYRIWAHFKAKAISKLVSNEAKKNKL